MAHLRQKIQTIVLFTSLASMFLIVNSVLNTRQSVEIIRNKAAYPQPQFKPTTYLPQQKCDPISCQPLKKVASFRNKSLTELATIHGDFETPLAICNFSLRDNFAHVMQYLYACYTFWQDNPSHVPVLYPLGHAGKEKMIQVFSETPFLMGFMDLLTSQMKVEIFTDEEIFEWLKANITETDGVFLNSNLTNMYPANFGIDFKEDDNGKVGDNENFRFHKIGKIMGYTLSHVDTLNQMAQQQLDFGEGKRNENIIDYRHKATLGYSPKIGILNRRPSNGRSITNAQYLVQNINSDALVGIDPIPSSALPISLFYFEGKSFKEQVQFFQNIDLLISPHGAQLTGIPFLANKPCTQIIEFFPDNYLIPFYYGTLAHSSGIEYSYVYASNSSADMSDEGEERRVSPSRLERVAARSQSFCLSPVFLVDILKDAVRHWHKCQKLSKNESYK